ncbi:MAG: stage 0 sporulation family protein [Bacilli bacterium]|nr:stage 0 sporulation family protein [Bacilli bacterium]
MPKVIGIQFKGVGRIYYFDPLDFVFESGEYAIVETVRGLELGKVILGNHEVPAEKLEAELKPVSRKATERDLRQEERNNELAKEAFKFFKKSVVECGLEMKPLYAEYTIDRSKVVFFYTADDRVDFRNLLKILTPEFKSRVELRQIGPREAARAIGGLGGCGRELCCKSHLKNFDIVTMKMAKDQNLSLNTSKISGVCGKLMCCISYEDELYKELKKEFPNINSYVKTKKGDSGKVISVDYIKRTLRIQPNPDTMPITCSLDEIVEVRGKNQVNENGSN